MRGKKIGVAGIGGLTEILMRQILIANQVPLDQVTFLALGASDVTYVSLKAGVIDGTMLRSRRPFSRKMRVFESSLRAQNVYRVVQGGLTTAKATISERPEFVTEVIRATLRAVRLLKNDKTYALEFMKGPYLDLARSATGSPNAPMRQRSKDTCYPAWWTKSCSGR